MNPSETDRLMGIVEDALQTLPEAPAPAGLRSRVMRSVRTLSAAPKFAFPWLEAAISLMLSTMVTGLGTMLLGLSPAALQRLQQSARFFFLLPANRPLIAAVAVGAVMAGFCLVLSARLLLRGNFGLRFVPTRQG